MVVIAFAEVANLFTTRRGGWSLAAFALLWLCVLRYAIVPGARWLGGSSVPGSFEALDGLPLGSILGAVGLASLAEWPSPQLALYWILALSLLPPFAILVAADQTASDLGRGTLRFHALRVGRPTLFLGRFAGQCLIQLGLVIATLASVLGVVAFQTPGRLAESLLTAPLMTFDLVVLLLPWIALMAVCSALARSPRQATLYAVVAWILVWLVLALARDAFGPIAAFEHVLPGSEVSALRGMAGPATLALAPVPLVQTLVLLALGVGVFARRDL